MIMFGFGNFPQFQNNKKSKNGLHSFFLSRLFWVRTHHQLSSVYCIMCNILQIASARKEKCKKYIYYIECISNEFTMDNGYELNC